MPMGVKLTWLKDGIELENLKVVKTKRDGTQNFAFGVLKKKQKPFCMNGNIHLVLPDINALSLYRIDPFIGSGILFDLHGRVA